MPALYIEKNKPAHRGGKAIELEWILRFVLFGIIHWVLAIMMLQDLASRKRVLGRHKWPWALVILLVTFFGSVLYLLCHPRIFVGGDEEEKNL